MGRRASWVVILVLLSVATTLEAQVPRAVPAVGAGEAELPKLRPWRERSFRLPLEVAPAERPRLREVQLLVSQDRGRTWRQYASARPDETGFEYTSRGDGEYWFLLRTVDRDGRAFPEDPTGLPPRLRVLIDTTPPEIALRSLGTENGQIGVQWRIIEQHPDLGSFRLQFRPQGSEFWYPVQIEAALDGQAWWRVGLPGPIEMRLCLLDRAGNDGCQTLLHDGEDGGRGGAAAPPASRAKSGGGLDGFIPPRPAMTPLHDQRDAARQDTASRYPQRGSEGDVDDLRVPPARPRPEESSADPPAREQGRLVPPDEPEPAGAPSPRPTERADSAPPPADPERRVRLVNSMQFDLNYGFEGQGRSGIGSVSLYYTYDGRVWKFWGEDDDKESPFPIRVDGPGLYGFTLVVRSGAGLGDDPPVAGDPPQVWVEVDLEVPRVHLEPPRARRGEQGVTVDLAWQSSDRNLVPNGARLSYAESPTGPWTTIRDNLPSNGQLAWPAPADVPYRLFLRLEAADRAGNIGRLVTEQPVVVDLARPRPVITDVTPSDPLDFDARRFAPDVPSVSVPEVPVLPLGSTE